MYVRWEQYRRGRGAGTIAASAASDRPATLPAGADFASGVYGSAFWRHGRLLYRSSGTTVIRDVRMDLPRDLALTGAAMWTPAVLEAVWMKAASLGQTRPTAAIVAGQPLPREWLRLALWLTYDGRSPLVETELPVDVRLPVLGVELGANTGLDQTTSIELATSDLARDPFVVGAGGPGGGGGGGARRPASSSNTAKWVLGALAAYLLLGKGRSDG